MAWKGTRMMLRIGNDQGPAYSVQRIGKEKILSPIPDPLSPHKGVTLVEVLLAVVILSIGIAGVLRAYAASIGALEISRDTVNTIELGSPREARAVNSKGNLKVITGHGRPGRVPGKVSVNWPCPFFVARTARDSFR